MNVYCEGKTVDRARPMRLRRSEGGEVSRFSSEEKDKGTVLWPGQRGIFAIGKSVTMSDADSRRGLWTSWTYKWVARR